jgi:hypothetical protein
MPPSHSLVKRFAALLCAAATFLTAPQALAADAAACWARFFHDADFTGDAGPIRTFRYAGQTFHIPANYLWRGIPEHPDHGLWLLAWPPHLEPGTRDRNRAWTNPWAPLVRITIFGHEGQITTDQSLAWRLRSDIAEQIDGEVDAFGLRVFRSSLTRPSYREYHMSPEPNHFFECTAEGYRPNPLCNAHRTMAGPLRLQMTFRRAEMHRYADFDRALTRMMCCAVDPADAPDAAWPPRNCG